MIQQSLNDGLSFTQPYLGIWYVYLAGRRVGTVNGDGSVGFTARDMEYRAIGRDFVSAEAAMQAWVAVTD